jgi:hypothetical protein
MTSDLAGHYHSLASQLASEAEDLLRADALEEAQHFYAEAGQYEEYAFRASGPSLIRTRSILAVSATALYFKAREFLQAERLALEFLTNAELNEFAHNEVKATLQAIWEAKELAESRRQLSEEELQIAIRGSEIGAGRAPLGLVLDKVIGVRSVLYRITEYLLDKPLRTRGGPSEEVREICQPWVSEPMAGSFRFTLRLATPLQPELIPSGRVQPSQINERFLDIIRAVSPTTALGSELNQLEEAIADEAYRPAILKLVRNLVPDGHRITEMEFVTSGGKHPSEALLHVGARSRIESSLYAGGFEEGSSEVRGVLRAVDLERNWLEILPSDSDGVKCKIGHEILDDVVGPMLNRPVIARVKKMRSGRMDLLDIELDRTIADADGMTG